MHDDGPHLSGRLDIVPQRVWGIQSSILSLQIVILLMGRSIRPGTGVVTALDILFAKRPIMHGFQDEDVRY
jgi:hypothetical protein